MLVLLWKQLSNATGSEPAPELPQSKGRPLQDGPLLTVLKLIWVLCCLFRKFSICVEVAFPALREPSLMYWSSDCVVTLGLPDRAANTADPVPCTAPLETFTLAMIWGWESPSLLRIWIWLLTFWFSIRFLRIPDYFWVYMRFSIWSQSFGPLCSIFSQKG